MGSRLLKGTYLTFLVAFAGANVLVGAGMIQESLVTSHEQLVIDDEICRTVVRALEGFKVDEERLGLGADGSGLVREEISWRIHTPSIPSRGKIYAPPLISEFEGGLGGSRFKGFRRASKDTGQRNSAGSSSQSSSGG